MRLLELFEAEAERAIKHTAERLAQDMYRGGSPVKIYSEGAANADPTWVGRCVRCGHRYVHATLHWPTRSIWRMLDHCDRPQSGVGVLQGYVCGGEVEHDPNSDALLSVFLMHGYDAIQDRPGQPAIQGLEAFLAPRK